MKTVGNMCLTLICALGLLGVAVGGAKAVPPWTEAVGPTATGGRTATVSIEGGGPGCGYDLAEWIHVDGDTGSPPADSAPFAHTFPFGLFHLSLQGCTPGSTVTFTMSFSSLIPQDMELWSYGPTALERTELWYRTRATVGRDTMIFKITDGERGDDDLAADGGVSALLGPAYLSTVVRPLVKINGQLGPLAATPGTNISVTVDLASGSLRGTNADWWAVAVPLGSGLDTIYSYEVGTGWSEGLKLAIQAPLLNMEAVQIFNGELPAGDYAFYFGVDTNPNGIIDEPLWFDAAAVTVRR